MSDIEKAKQLLDTGTYTCVLCRGATVLTSCERGVKPLMDFIATGTDCADFSAADKLIGKAAAILFTILKVKEIYSPVISKAGCSVFEKYGIPFSCIKTPAYIINRQGTDLCPMEKAVKNINDPKKALAAIKTKQEELKKDLIQR